VSLRTYRVIVRGVLAELDDDQRTRLRAGLAAHDLFVAAFTETGSLSYDAALGPFSHRVVVQVDAGPGEEDDAHTAGELSAMAALEELGVTWRNLRSTVTCMDDVKIRRR
jgi:hypothetical protein